MPKYIPDRDGDFDVWFQNYQQYAVANAVALGLTPAQALEIQTAKINWSLGYSNLISARNAYQAAQEIKDEKREAGETVIRKITGIVQKRPETTDAQREGLGITVPDRQPTPLDPEAIRHIAPPILLPDFSQRGQVTIHFGPNPQDEHKNALPEIARAVRLQFYIGVVTPGTDVNALPWQWLADDTHSPYLHILNGPVTVSYRAQYIDLNLHLGTLCDPVTVTITA